MSIYHISGGISSFGCEFGNIEIDADGFAEIPNGMIVQALINHGFQVTPKGDDAPPPDEGAGTDAGSENDTKEEPPALPLNGARKSGEKKQQPKAASEEEALDRAIGAVTGK